MMVSGNGCTCGSNWLTVACHALARSAIAGEVRLVQALMTSRSKSERLRTRIIGDCVGRRPASVPVGKGGRPSFPNTWLASAM